MKPTQLFVLTLVAMTAFAGNSLLCRLALKQTAIDPASFTSIRILSGAAVLWLIAGMRNVTLKDAGNWPSALALFGYAAAFSFAYVTLSAGTGALLLFGAVQATMILWGLFKGERLRVLQIAGLTIAVAGLVVLVFPGLSAPPSSGSILMLTAGVAWGIYSLRGKASGDPAATTAGNFLRAVPLALVLSLTLLPWARLDRAGVGYAMLFWGDSLGTRLCRLVRCPALAESGQRRHRPTQRSGPRRRGRDHPAGRTPHPAFPFRFPGGPGRNRSRRLELVSRKS